MSSAASAPATSVVVDGDEVTGFIDYSDASQDDALVDLATLTLGHEEHLGDVVASYDTNVDRDLICACGRCDA